MEILRPLCGSLEEHPAHYVNHLDRQCEGCGAEWADTSVMILALWRFAQDHSMPGREVPEGTQLLVHPSVRNALVRYTLPSYSDVTRLHLGELRPVPGVPLVISTDLLPGGWRLAIGGYEGVIRDGMGGD